MNALQATQQKKSSVRLSDRNVVELVNKLKQLGFLGDDLLYTMNGKEYITTDRLRTDIERALQQAGGRLELLELPALVGVDLVHCERQVCIFETSGQHGASSITKKLSYMQQHSSSGSGPPTCQSWMGWASTACTFADTGPVTVTARAPTAYAACFGCWGPGHPATHKRARPSWVADGSAVPGGGSCDLQATCQCQRTGPPLQRCWPTSLVVLMLTHTGASSCLPPHPFRHCPHTHAGGGYRVRQQGRSHGGPGGAADHLLL